MVDLISIKEEVANLRYSSASVLVAPLSNGTFAVWSFLYPNGPVSWDVTYTTAEHLAEVILTASEESKEKAKAFSAARPSDPVKAPYPAPTKTKDNRKELSIEDLF